MKDEKNPEIQNNAQDNQNVESAAEKGAGRRAANAQAMAANVAPTAAKGNKCDFPGSVFIAASPWSLV